MSSFVIVAPQDLAAASRDLTGIGSAIKAANAAAAGSTTQVLAAAGDEVSATIWGNGGTGGGGGGGGIGGGAFGIGGDGSSGQPV